MRRIQMDYIIQMMPALVKAQMFPPDLLDIFPLSQRLIQKIKQFVQQRAQMDMQMKLQGIGAPGRGKSRTPDEVKADLTATQAKAALGFAKAEHLKAQAHDIGRAGKAAGLKDIFDGLLNVHKADLEERKHRIERATAAADIIASLRQPQGASK
jgi:hypothetical protein